MKILKNANFHQIWIFCGKTHSKIVDRASDEADANTAAREAETVRDQAQNEVTRADNEAKRAENSRDQANKLRDEANTMSAEIQQLLPSKMTEVQTLVSQITTPRYQEPFESIE